MKLIRHALISFGGMVMTFILLSGFVEIDVRFFSASSDPFTRASDTAWRFDWVFNPLIVVLSSFAVASVADKKYAIASGLVAILPFLIVFSASSPLRTDSLLFVAGYVLLVSAVSSTVWVVRR